jgi:hypothetical protein
MGGEMKSIRIHKRTSTAAFAVILSALVFIACDDRQYEPYHGHGDYEAPPVPTGLTSVTEDQAVLLYWDAVRMDPDYDDLAGYKIYRSNDNSLFTRIATVGRNTTQYTDEGLQNGRTYFYAVSSFDYDGNESELSSENVFDTPRPEGFDYVIFTYDDPIHYRQSGFDLSTQSYLPWDSRSCDLFAEYDTSAGAFFLWLGQNGYRIQDMGYTGSFDEITYAPNGGWSQFDYSEIIEGHTYVIWTADNHYAKVRVTGLFYSPSLSMRYDWGYQIDPGNRELKIEPSNHQTVTQNQAEVQ